jgi:hypothetical protein
MSKKIALVALFVMALSNFAIAEPIVTESTSTTNSNSKSETTVKSPPPTAVAPAVTTINNDVCATAASGAVQTQILGISMGGTVRDMNCERIKLSKNLYDMGMKVAAVATLCQDDRVFQAMLDAGTPCPVMGKIGEQAKEIWISRGRVDEKDIVKQTPEKKETQPIREIGALDNKVTPVEVQGEANTSSSGFPFRHTSCPGYAGTDPIVKARLGCQ